MPNPMGTKRRPPKHALDNRTPTVTGIRARSHRWTSLTFLVRSAMPAALELFWCAGSPAMAQEGGFIQGKAIDSSGAPIYGALVTVKGANGSQYTTGTDDKGVFRISSLALGNYSVKISASAFSDWTTANVPASATPESELLAVLQVAPQVTAVTVGVPPEEVAAEQISHQLKQRTLAVIPNFYVTYESHPAPLSPK